MKLSKDFQNNLLKSAKIYFHSIQFQKCRIKKPAKPYMPFLPYSFHYPYFSSEGNGAPLLLSIHFSPLIKKPSFYFLISIKTFIFTPVKL